MLTGVRPSHQCVQLGLAFARRVIVAADAARRAKFPPVHHRNGRVLKPADRAILAQRRTSTASSALRNSKAEAPAPGRRPAASACPTFQFARGITERAPRVRRNQTPSLCLPAKSAGSNQPDLEQLPRIDEGLGQIAFRRGIASEQRPPVTASERQHGHIPVCLRSASTTCSRR